MIILSWEFGIKPSDGVCPPNAIPTHKDRKPLSLPSSSCEYFCNVKDQPWIGVIFNKHGNSNNHCDISRFLLLFPCLFLTLSHITHMHTHIKSPPPLDRASYMEKVDEPWKAYSVDPADKLTNWVHLSRKTFAQMWSLCLMESLPKTLSHPHLCGFWHGHIAETLAVLLQIFSGLQQDIS